MAITNVAMSAYTKALESGGALGRAQGATLGSAPSKEQGGSFVDTLSDSIKSVNDLDGEKNRMVQAFASGQEQNVHELMITLQKSGIAVSMTAAVRNKVLDAYKQLMQVSF